MQNVQYLTSKQQLESKLVAPHIDPRLHSFLLRVWENRAAIRTSGKRGLIYNMYLGTVDVRDDLGLDQLKEFLQGLHDKIGGLCDQIQSVDVEQDLAHVASTYLDPERVAEEDFEDWVDTVDCLGKTFYHYNRTLGCIATQRVYLNVKPDKAIEVMGWVVEDIVRKANFYPGVKKAKVAGPANDRPDTIVIWIADEDAKGGVLDAINSYQSQAGYRDRFRMETPAFAQNVGLASGSALRGVAVAMDPSDPTISFGKSRTNVIFDAIDRAIQAGNDRGKFINDVLGDLRAAGIDVRNPHLHRRD